MSKNIPQAPALTEPPVEEKPEAREEVPDWLTAQESKTPQNAKEAKSSKTAKQSDVVKQQNAEAAESGNTVLPQSTEIPQESKTAEYTHTGEKGNTALQQEDVKLQNTAKQESGKTAYNIKKTVYLAQEHDDKLWELMAAFKKRTGVKLRDQEIIRRCIETATIDSLMP